MNRILSRFRDDVGGATAIEYTLIAAFIAMVLVAVLTAIGPNLAGIFQSVVPALS